MLQEFIKKEFTKIIKEAIYRYAKLWNTDASQVQLILCLKPALFFINPKNAGEFIRKEDLSEGGAAPEGWVETEIADNCYKVCEKYAPKAEITFLQLLNKKFDIKQYSKIVPPFINKALMTLAEKKGIDFHQISVMLYEAKDQIRLCLYSGTQMVGLLGFEDIFSPEVLSV